MKRHREKEWSIEEFDAWLAATDRHEAIAAAADEEGGPRLSLVTTTDRAPPAATDLLAPDLPAPAGAGSPADTTPAADALAPSPPNPAPIAAEPLDGVALTDSRRRAGWSAERQRRFLAALAETGSVHLASAAARLSARSAYQLRARSTAFATAWDTAEQLAVGRLSALAFDRAIHGRTEQIWHEGQLVVEKRLPSDKLLMWLLARLDPRRFAAPWEQRKDGAADPQADARAAFPAQLDAIADLAADDPEE